MLEEEENLDDVETCTRLIYSTRDSADVAVHKITKNFRENSIMKQAVWNYTSRNAALIQVQCCHFGRFFF